MLYDILIFLICFICIQLFSISLKNKLEKYESRRTGKQLMKDMTDAKLEAMCDDKENRNIYRFEDLPEEIQKVILEYIPPSFYEVLGEDSYDFLNKMDTIQIREFNKATIESYKTIIRTKDMVNIIDIISTTISVSLFWIIIIIK